MLSDSDSPGQQSTYPKPSSRGGGGFARGLYHSPPLHRGQPPVTRNTRSQGRDSSWDTCEDITAYALGIVKSLEIPDDERREKEEFCRDLEEIVQRIRPSISPFLLHYPCTDELVANVELFGSFANTFTIANSDIDCCVTDPNSTSNEIQQSGLPELLQQQLNERGTPPPCTSNTQASKQHS